MAKRHQCSETATREALLHSLAAISSTARAFSCVECFCCGKWFGMVEEAGAYVREARVVRPMPERLVAVLVVG